MNIQWYDGMLYNGQSVYPSGLPRMRLAPPDAENADAGPLPGVDASQAVELQRALTGWLSAHRRRHLAWHKAYRERDPGNRRATEEEAAE